MGEQLPADPEFPVRHERDEEREEPAVNLDDTGGTDVAEPAAVAPLANLGVFDDGVRLGEFRLVRFRLQTSRVEAYKRKRRQPSQVGRTVGSVVPERSWLGDLTDGPLPPLRRVGLEPGCPRHERRVLPAGSITLVRRGVRCPIRFRLPPRRAVRGTVLVFVQRAAVNSPVERCSDPHE